MAEIEMQTLLSDQRNHELYSEWRNTANRHEHPHREAGTLSEVVKLEGEILGLREVAAQAWDEGVAWAVSRRDGDEYCNPFRETSMERF